MKIAIVGGGFTGLSAAIDLLEKGHQVSIFESSDKVGGLATGFKPKGWRWSLEIFYHHIFTNDKEIINLSKKVGLPPTIYSPITTSYIYSQEVQLDSPISLLRFKGLSVFSRLRLGVGLALLKIIPNGQFLEKYKVVNLLPVIVGRKGYEVIWEKLLKAKFGSHYTKVNMAWFWTRVAKRTQKLGYFEGGFQNLADKCSEYIKRLGGEINLSTGIEEISKVNDKFQINAKTFDKVLVTTPAPLVDKIIGLGKVSWPEIDYLWGQTLIIEIKRKLINGYWMNILENSWPFLVVVEHTNLIKKTNYANKEIVYLGNYLEDGDERLNMSNESLLKLYLPYLKKINKNFKKDWIINVFRFKQPYSQPVFPTNYSSLVPKFKTSDKNIYVANMSMVYPFDRGTNYAVKMGKDVARQMLFDL